MQIGLIGLRPPGRRVARRLLAHAHEVRGYDRDPGAVEAAAEDGIAVAETLEALLQRLEPPRVLWVMVPSHGGTRAVLDALAERLAPGDIVVDAGPSALADTRRRATMLHRRSLLFLDASLHPAAPDGFTLLVGGPEPAVDRLRPVFEALAPPAAGGWHHVGPNGAAHYVRMVREGVLAAVRQATAEGRRLLRHARDAGLDLTADAIEAAPVLLPEDLATASEAGNADGTGRSETDGISVPEDLQRLVEHALSLGVAAPLLTLALVERLRTPPEPEASERPA